MKFHFCHQRIYKINLQKFNIPKIHYNHSANSLLTTTLQYYSTYNKINHTTSNARERKHAQRENEEAETNEERIARLFEKLNNR